VEMNIEKDVKKAIRGVGKIDVLKGVFLRV
jgi:hypothetical protein